MHQQAASRRAPLPRWARLALGAAAVASIVLAIQWRRNATTPDYLQACLNGEAQKRAVLYETTLEDKKRGGRTLQTHWLRNCGLHLQKKTMQLDATIANGIGYVQVDTSKKYQTIEGFGGAFTEASAKTWMRLPLHERKRVIDLYFGENGAGYTVGRVHMNSCDFCVSSYDFAPVDNDYELKHFDSSVKHDQAEMIPLMRAAKKAVERRNQEFKLFASPWSPPAWLKAPNSIPPMRPTITFDHNRSMLGSAHPLGLRNSPEAFAAWALYYSKFAAAYDRQNLTLWGFTVQNEPEFSAPWGGGVLVVQRGAFVCPQLVLEASRRWRRGSTNAQSRRVDGVEAQKHRETASMAYRTHTRVHVAKTAQKKNTGGRPAAGTLLPQQILSETI